MCCALLRPSLPCRQLCQRCMNGTRRACSLMRSTVLRNSTVSVSSAGNNPRRAGSNTSSVNASKISCQPSVSASCSSRTCRWPITLKCPNISRRRWVELFWPR